MTPQDLYTKVRKHLLTQMQKAFRAGGSGRCAYRTASGLTCAIGCLISKENYSEELEGKTGIHTVVLEAAGLSGQTGLDSLILDLQEVHDNYDVVEWSTRLNAVAERHNLEVQ